MDAETSSSALELIRTTYEELYPEARRGAAESRGRARVLVNGVHADVVWLPTHLLGIFLEEVQRRGNDAFFDGALPKCQFSWNRRFRNSAGRINCGRRHIELSSAHYEACGPLPLAVVFIHEMIHLSLYEDHLPHGHTREFKRRSWRLGLPRIHHELPLPERITSARRYQIYQCRSCQRVTESRVRFRRPRACGRCCRQFAQGRFDRRFLLLWKGERVGFEQPSTGVA